MAMKWHGTEAVRRIKAVTADRLEGAAMYVRTQARKNISRSQPTRLVHARAGGSYRRGLDPSKPGEYPKKVMGQLRQRVAYEIDRHVLKARVGTNLAYGKHLETGTANMLARPWLLRTVTEHSAFIRAKFGVGPKV